MRQFEIDIDDKPFIDGREGRHFRAVFTTRMAYTDKLAFLDLAIYNLSRDTDVRQGSKVLLRAGYDDDIDVIFQGTITTVLKERHGPDIITRLLCRSGANDVRKSVRDAVGKNGTVLECIKKCAQVLGPGGTPLPVRIDESQFADCPVLVRGYVLEGNAVDALDKLASQFDFGYVIAGDALHVDRRNKAIKGTAQEVSLFTGMIGVPEAEGDVGLVFVNVTTKLKPRISIGSNIDLKSEYATYSTGNYYIVPPENGGKLSGRYKVIEISHQGDSWGNRWQTAMRVQKT